jgi:hypothetical protein
MAVNCQTVFVQVKRFLAEVIKNYNTLMLLLNSLHTNNNRTAQAECLRDKM